MARDLSAPRGHNTVEVFYQGREIPAARFYSGATNEVTNYLLAQEALANVGIDARMSEISLRVR